MTVRRYKRSPKLAVINILHGRNLLTTLDSANKRGIGRKSRFFHTPAAFDVPVKRSRSEYYHKVWQGKIEWCDYATVKKFDNILLVSTYYTNTAHDSIGRANAGVASRAAITHNIWPKCLFRVLKTLVHCQSAFTLNISVHGFVSTAFRVERSAQPR